MTTTICKRTGGEILADMYVDSRLDGVPLNFQRRRYSNKTFTWVEAFLGGAWVSLGDPWPCVTPARKELRLEIAIRQPETISEKI